jgi:class 3 adenylate cyclase
VAGDATSGPAGETVTFLLTDIQGSTRHWEASPDHMRVWTLAESLEPRFNLLRSVMICGSHSIGVAEAPESASPGA